MMRMTMKINLLPLHAFLISNMQSVSASLSVSLSLKGVEECLSMEAVQPSSQSGILNHMIANGSLGSVVYGFGTAASFLCIITLFLASHPTRE